LRDVVRAPDTVARLGGDEFAIVLELDEAGAIAVADRILAALGAPLQFEGRELSVTASIGLAFRSQDEGEADLLRNADIAMYVAKKNGKGRIVVFDAGMHRAVTERNELAKDLEGASARGELRVVYQPLVMLSDGGITGFEALLRWEHPRFGKLSPTRFIPLAEEGGQIVEIGRWLLREACTQAQAWEDEFPSGVPRSISVNVSVRQLAEPSFPDHVIEALRASHLAPERLILEITETSLVGDNSDVVRSLHRLKSLGVRIALDDFGTGYSSLGYLKRLPIDMIKIDKTFIDGVDRGAEDAALARAILKIAESMSLQCIAEGVERRSQATQLIAAGCKLAQGFLFSKAVEPNRVGALLFWHPRPPKARGTVLIVDDESMFRASMARRLGEAGFATVEASNGTEALDTLAERSVDLIMLDVHLPDVNGLDLGMQIRRNPALSSIPIMIVSGDPVAVPSGPEPPPGIDAFVQKPFRDSEWLTRVTRLIDRPTEHAGASR
jgi:predicted signal transduction protein with EAL and GGDEF domain/CheY-like chemotaxis protein